MSPKGLFDSIKYGFSQVVQCNTGKMIFISGQVSCDENFKVIGENDLELQTEKAVENIKLAMESVGGTLDNIVMLRIYKVDYKREDGRTINNILKKHFGTISPPASTWISVNGLVDEKYMIEIEAQAVI